MVYTLHLGAKDTTEASGMGCCDVDKAHVHAAENEVQLRNKRERLYEK